MSARSTPLPPHPVRADIDPAGCIGCTKCLPACPVDAILGARQRLHSVLEQACTGCGLCLPPCPTNCIALVPVALPFSWPTALNDDATAATAFLATQSAMESERKRRRDERLAPDARTGTEDYVTPPSDPVQLRDELEAALARAGKTRRKLPASGTLP